MSKRIFLSSLVACFLLFALSVKAQLLKDKITIGRIEWIEIPSLNLKFKSRIDTGAKTSSMHATNIQEIIRDGETYVSFTTLNPKGENVNLTLKAELTQKVANTAGKVSVRYVVKEKIKIGKFEKEIFINLNPRSKMTYKFLVGRNLLLGRFVVDVARSHVLGDN